MNRNDIVYLHGEDAPEGAHTLFCLSGRPYNTIRHFLDVARELRLINTTMWLWNIRKWDKKHMKDHHIYLGSIRNKRFFDVNFKEMRLK